MKKYIVDNLSSQSITGQLTIDGGLTASDATIDGNLVVKGGLTVVDAENFTTLTYKALLTQYGVQSGTQSIAFNYAFIVGEEYTITNYLDGDDFTNIGATINATGSVFTATGEIPNVWTNGSEITSSGNLVVDVLENTLGYDLYWDTLDPGLHIAYPDISLGGMFLKYNNFPRNKTYVTIQDNRLPYFPFDPNIFLKYFSSVGSLSTKDDVVAIGVWDTNLDEYSPNFLYFTPVEINIKQNVDTTLIAVPGGSLVDFSVQATVDVVLFNNDEFVEVFTTSGSTTNNITELVTLLNNDVNTSFLGVFSDDGNDGLEFSMYANIVERFNTFGTLNFLVAYTPG